LKTEECFGTDLTTPHISRWHLRRICFTFIWRRFYCYRYWGLIPRGWKKHTVYL